MRKLYYEDLQTPTGVTSSSLRHHNYPETAPANDDTINCFSFSDASRSQFNVCTLD